MVGRGVRRRLPLFGDHETGAIRRLLLRLFDEPAPGGVRIAPGQPAELPAHFQRAHRAAQDAFPPQRSPGRHGQPVARAATLPGAAPLRSRLGRGASRPGGARAGRVRPRVARPRQAHEPLDPRRGAELRGDPERDPGAARRVERMGLSPEPGRPAQAAHLLGGARSRVDPHARPKDVLSRERAAELLRLSRHGLRRPVRSALRRERTRGVRSRVRERRGHLRRRGQPLHPEHQRGGVRGLGEPPVPGALGQGGLRLGADPRALRSPRLAAMGRRPLCPSPGRAAEQLSGSGHVPAGDRLGLRAGRHRMERPPAARGAPLRVLQSEDPGAGRPRQPRLQHLGRSLRAAAAREPQAHARAAPRSILSGDVQGLDLLRLRALLPDAAARADLLECRLLDPPRPPGEHGTRLRHVRQPGRQAGADGPIPVRVQAGAPRLARARPHAVLQGHPGPPGQRDHHHLQ